MTGRDYGVNVATPQIMWIDLNSAFATIEQQAHPSLRHRPVGIVNRLSPNCCIITASYEARKYGIKVMRRQEALARCPELVILESDPPKYNAVYQKLKAIMADYSPVCGMKSIDEGYIDLHGTKYDTVERLTALGYEIKRRVKEEIGDYITINVGIGANRFLAKLAAGLHKPDGMDIITVDNILKVYGDLALEDLTGIAGQLGRRLRRAGINTPLDFLAADERTLRKGVFHSISGTYWYQRLRGYEVDDYETHLSVIGRQWAVDQNGDDDEYLLGCLNYLAECVGVKLRFREAAARGVGLWLRYDNGETFRRKFLYEAPFTDNRPVWLAAERLFRQRPPGRVQWLGLYVYHLSRPNENQLSLLTDINRAHGLTRATDSINRRYGTAAIHSARATVGVQRIKQKIPFGSTAYFDLLG